MLSAFFDSHVVNNVSHVLQEKLKIGKIARSFDCDWKEISLAFVRKRTRSPVTHM